MKLVSLVAPLALAVTVTTAAAQPAAKPAPPRAYEVSAIHAFLYFHGTGAFDDKDLTSGKVALWNTMIGEGDAGAPSSIVLVKVDVGGPTFASAPGTLVVEAKEGKKRLARQTFTVADYFDETSGKITVPLILTGVGCEAVTVTATLSGKGIKSKRTAEIPFACGE